MTESAPRASRKALLFGGEQAAPAVDPGIHDRPDIDGLRAVAILCVVLIDVGRNVANGVAGVDVFFVISGYLITRTIERESGRRPFSLGRFYERRARRIFPALFTVLALTSAASVLLLPPEDFIRFGESLIAASLFVSNVFFIGEAQRGLLDGSFPMPLLHTWSLAIGEQFYLLFPLLLMFLARRANASEKIRLMWLLMAASLILNTILVKELPFGALYLAQSRAWELLAGVLLALGALPPVRARLLREALGAAGLVLIIAGAVVSTMKTPLAVSPALAAVLGAVLVLYSGEGGTTLVSRLLGSRLPVGIGGISYSLYLWHWPIMTMTGLIVGHRLALEQQILVVVLSAGFAFLSWRYVERPFRVRGTSVASRTRIFQLSFSGIAAACSLGVVLYAGDGWPGRPHPAFNHARSSRCVLLASLPSAQSGGPRKRNLNCAPR